VQVLGRGDQDAMDVRPGEQLAVVPVAGDIDLLDLLRACDPAIELGLGNIADRAALAAGPFGR